MRQEKNRQLNLSQKEIAGLQTQYKKVKSRGIGDRILCVLLKAQGRTHEEVSQILLVDTDTISRWLHIYLEKGVNALLKSALKENNLKEDKKEDSRKKRRKSKTRSKRNFTEKVKLYLIAILISGVIGLAFSYLTGGLPKFINSVIQGAVHNEVEKAKADAIEKLKADAAEKLDKNTIKKLDEDTIKKLKKDAGKELDEDTIKELLKKYENSR